MIKVEIRIKGSINQKWGEWFSELTISHSDPGETVLSGIVPDQAALYGIISHLRDLGMPLTSVSTEMIDNSQGNQSNK